MDFVPEPPVGIIELSLRTDGRYGMQDPIQWPQVIPSEYEFLSTILRKRDQDHRHAPLWWTPQPQDFEPAKGSAFTSLGLIKTSRMQPLASLVEKIIPDIYTFITGQGPSPTLKLFEISMRRALERLQYFPCSFRDATLQVRTVQRFWLYCRSFMDHMCLVALSTVRPSNHVNRQFMGAFTSDPGTVQRLFAAGIPVWFVRPDVSLTMHTSVCTLVRTEPPRDLCLDQWDSQARALYVGLAGARHINIIQRTAHIAMYLDVSRVPLLTPHASLMQHRPHSDQSSSGAPGSLVLRTGATSRPHLPRRVVTPCTYAHLLNTD